MPQFIEVQDKIIGPLTIKQFLYILGGAGALLMIWTIAPSITAFLVPAVPVLGIVLALAFYKMNGRPFSTFLQAAFAYLIRPKALLWRREYTIDDIKTDAKEAQEEKPRDEHIIGKHVTESRLKRLSQVLNNSGGVDESVYGLSDSGEISPYEGGDQEKSKVAREQKVEELLGKR